MQNILQKTWKISDILKNFSNENKLAILCYLGEEERNVSDIMKCSKISQSQISQYLWKMKLEWILTAKKEGKEVFYKIKDKKVLELIFSLKNIFK